MPRRFERTCEMKDVYVPQIYPVFSTRRLIVMELSTGSSNRHRERTRPEKTHMKL
jgi:predicted unusual protein kinase regulating ubiquinone biosynthesis (AarF/ABC1/UbiB family)